MSETYELVNDNDEASEEKTAAQNAFDDMNAALSDAGENTSIHIYRQTGSGREAMEFICKYPADLYELGDLLEKIRKEYGGGNYRFMLREGNKLCNNKLIPIAEKLEPSTIPLGSADVGTNTLAIVEKMMQQNNENIMLLMTKMEQNRVPVQDSHNGMLQTMQLMTVMKEFLAPAPVEPAKTPIEMLREVSEIKNLFDGDSGGESNGLVNLANNFAPKLMELVENQQTLTASKALPQATGPAAPAPSKAVNPMTPHIHTLLSFAKVNKDTEDTAKLVLTHTKKEDFAELNRFLVSDKCLPSILAMNPEVTPYIEWFIELRLTLLDFIDNIRTKSNESKEASATIETPEASQKEPIPESKGDSNNN